MYLLELNELIENGENSKVEFKRKFSTAEKIAKEMIAFANTVGGDIIFGVDDDRNVVGVESEKGEIELIDTAAKFYCNPEISYAYEILHIYRKDVIIIHVPESRTKPHSLIENNDSNNGNHSRVYIRVNDKTIQASKETVRVLKRSNPDSPPLILELGEKERFLLDYLSRNERINVQALRKLLNLSERRASRMLVNLVRAGLILLHHLEKEDYYTLSEKLNN
jgi:predicted HTH transcriptional regulator